MIFADGVIYFLIAYVNVLLSSLFRWCPLSFLCNLIATVFMLINLNQIMTVIFNVPAAVFSTVSAPFCSAPVKRNSELVDRLWPPVLYVDWQSSPIMDLRSCTLSANVDTYILSYSNTVSGASSVTNNRAANGASTRNLPTVTYKSGTRSGVHVQVCIAFWFLCPFITPIPPFPDGDVYACWRKLEWPVQKSEIGHERDGYGHRRWSKGIVLRIVIQWSGTQVQGAVENTQTRRRQLLLLSCNYLALAPLSTAMRAPKKWDAVIWMTVE